MSIKTDGAKNWGRGVLEIHPLFKLIYTCLFSLYAEYIMRNARLDESQAGIKTARRNINNLRYADDTTLRAKSKEELGSLLMRVRGEKAGLKLNIQKTKITAFGPITSWQTDGGKMETVIAFYLYSKITVDSDCSHEIKRHLLLGRKATCYSPWGRRVKHNLANKQQLPNCQSSAEPKRIEGWGCLMSILSFVRNFKKGV